jgi:hypothetical protein
MTRTRGKVQQPEFEVCVDWIDGDRVYVIVSRSGERLYWFFDQHQADAEASMLNRQRPRRPRQESSSEASEG